MRLSIFSLFLLFGCAVSAKTATKALTESLGQEVIEIGAPLKELPELEEEPSLEREDADVKAISKTSAPAVKTPLKKVVGQEGRRKMKDIDKIDGVNQEEDEQRVEKELADIYKDNDYKADSNELKASGEEDKALRQSKKTDFQFAPRDINDPRQVERFRTSPDYIDCKKKKLIPDMNNPDEVDRFKTSPDIMYCQRIGTTGAPDNASSISNSLMVLGFCALGVLYS